MIQSIHGTLGAHAGTQPARLEGSLESTSQGQHHPAELAGLTDQAPPLRACCQDACVNIWDYLTISYRIMKFIFPAPDVMC